LSAQATFYPAAIYRVRNTIGCLVKRADFLMLHVLEHVLEKRGFIASFNTHSRAGRLGSPSALT
jgi:hypothetical protein